MNRTHVSIDLTNQDGFAIAAKTLRLVAVVTGGGLLAVGKMSAHAPHATPGTRDRATHAPVILTDSDAELRPWLREAQSPTF